MNLVDSHVPLNTLFSGLRQRTLSCVELTRFMLDRIEAHNPVVNCYLDVFAEQALETAEARDRELDSGEDRGPLHGIPVAIKDIFDLPGHRASGGSRIERPALPIDGMRARHFDAGLTAGDPSAFPMLEADATGLRVCARCNYRELCGRG